MGDYGAAPSGKGYETKSGLCSKDSDCGEGQTCKGNACSDVCTPNPCSGGYKCIANGNSYNCAQCTADSDCASDKKCSDNTCIDACSGNTCASQNQKCSANSSHGYICYGCTSDGGCANDQLCDTQTSLCTSVCPAACDGNMICTVSGAHEATCSCESDDNCPEGQKCDLETKQCVAADCASVLLASRNDVAVATDAASFATAMSSGKSIIAIANDLTVNAAVTLGSKKLVGPKYFSDIPVCKEAERTILSSPDTLTFSNGDIEEIEIQFTFDNRRKTGIEGSGVIKNASIATMKSASYVISSENLTFQGNVVIEAHQLSDSNYAILKSTKNGKIDVYGALNLKAPFSPAGIEADDFSTVAVKNTGSLTMDMPEARSGIYLEKGSSFIAEGPVKLNGGFYSGIVTDLAENHNGYITLNANGNHFDVTHVIWTGDVPVTINGSTTINCKRVYGVRCELIRGSRKIEINAPFTVNNATQDDGIILSTGSITINNSIESTSRQGFISAASASVISSSGAILGASELYLPNLSVSTGARIKIGSYPCLKATASKTINLDLIGLGEEEAYDSIGDPFTDYCN